MNEGNSPVLVVDDTPAQLEELRCALEEGGYLVITATSVAGGLEAVGNGAFPVAISGVLMPGMDGHELCKALSARPSLKRLPVFLTSLADTYDVIRGLEAAADTFSCRSFKVDALKARIATILANEEARGGSASETGKTAFFAGQSFAVSADRLEIVELLLSAYDSAVSQNAELRRARDDLRVLSDRVEARVEQRTAALVSEVEERKKAQEREHHLNAVLRAIRDVNRLIVREKEPEQLISKVCALLVESRGYDGAWIAVEGPAGSISHWGQDGWGENFAPLARTFEQGQWPPCKEIVDRAVGAAVVEPERTCASCPLRLRDGQRECTVSILRHDERAWGMLCTSSPGRPITDEEELELLEEVAGDIAFGLAGMAAKVERKRAEDALGETEQWLREAQRLGRVGHWKLEIQTQEIRWSDVVYEIYGRNPALGPPTVAEEAKYYSAEDAGRLRERVAFAIEAGKPYELDVDVHRKDGWTANVVITGSAVKDADGRVVRLLGTVQDNTERKRAEEEKRHLQAALAQSDRLASMGMLAAGVAHEINNPLTYILYNLEGLSEEIPRHGQRLAALHERLHARLGPEPVRQVLAGSTESLAPGTWTDVTERFRDALAGARRIKAIARGLATFSKVESDQRESVQLRFPIESALNIAFNEIKYRARVEKDFASTAAVMGSEGKLSQVFLNLLINAAHAIPEGDAENNRIRVRTWQEGSTVFADVRDTGCGIPAENLERIFEPFFTTKCVGEGSGLGLSIIRNIIASFGGTIEVTSEVGEGTSFLIGLPAVTNEADEEEGIVSAGESQGIPGRILVVDDEPAIRRALGRVCRGHEVVTAASGLEAQEILSNDRQFDVVLCDMMMPAMSGMDLHRWALRVDSTLARRIVFVTGGAFTPGTREYLDQVENLRVEKPFDVTNLRKLIAEWVRLARTERS